ncbi:MAG: hypothetical protein NXI24_16945 [bacterium]|nr:hypothetical protein [bacterium]
MKALALCRDITVSGFRTFAENPWRSMGVVLLFLLCFFAANQIVRFAAQSLSGVPVAGSLLFGLLSAAITGYLMAGLLLFHLSILSNTRGEIRQLFQAGPYLLRILGLQLLSSAAFILFLAPALIAVANFPQDRWPMVLLYTSLIPAIWFTIRNSLSVLILLHENTGILSAIIRSFAYSKNRVWLLVLNFFILVIVYLSGFLLLGVGVLATASISMSMYCQLYASCASETAT